MILKFKNWVDNGSVESLISLDLRCRRQISVTKETVSKENQSILNKNGELFWRHNMREPHLALAITDKLPVYKHTQNSFLPKFYGGPGQFRSKNHFC